MKNWQSILNKFGGVRVLIVGDVMLDRYLWGTVSRISPEAPVPVVRLERVTETAGGAGNVAANAAALGAGAFLVGVIGADEAGLALPRILAANSVSSNYLVKFENRPTTCKTRVVAHSQQLVRIDDEDSTGLDDGQAEIVYRKILELLPMIDVVVLSDYAKGCLCERVLAETIKAAGSYGKSVLIDPKGQNYARYRGATLLTPNKHEAAAASGIEITDDDSCKKAGEKILAEVELESLLITLGEDGMRLFQKNRDSQHFPTMARKVYDVTGAGDTVIATLAAALGTGAELPVAAQLANAAAGIAVERVGTSAVSLELLRQVIAD